jgi:hypothetical protein
MLKYLKGGKINREKKMISWEIIGEEFGNCNCDYGCPCQFNALPTHGSCEAAVGMQIHKGHFGDVTLDGLRVAMVFWWPGPVHEGQAKMQIIVDEQASDQQREAIIKIIHGEETQPMATVWFIYSSMCPTKLETLSKPITLEIDIEERTGKVMVPDVFKTTGEPIRNPITGEAHRVRIDMPHGFEFDIAEIGSASTEAIGEIKLTLKDSYGQFNKLHINNHGPVRKVA